MLLIPCPNCGDRDESEFDYGGRAVDYPDLQAGAQDWHAALHLVDNSQRRIAEYWYHAAGCECWIRVERDLFDHEFGSGAEESD